MKVHAVIKNELDNAEVVQQKIAMWSKLTKGLADNGKS